MNFSLFTSDGAKVFKNNEMTKIIGSYSSIFLFSCKKNGLILNFFAGKFGGMKNYVYLCTRKSEMMMRALSSAGLEHLPYKQRVGGSNPSAPTSDEALG